MDPATLKMALQIAGVLAKSRMVRWVVGTVVTLAMLFGGLGIVYSTWTFNGQLAGSLRAAGMYGNCPAVPGVVVAGADAGDAAVSSRVMWPVPGHATGTYPDHSGVDINRAGGVQDQGDPIVAAASGKVTYVGTGKGYGEAVFVKTDIGPTTIYGHTSRQYVRAGQRVSVGELIANVGNTGHSTGPHLHFGVSPGLTYSAAMAFLKNAEPFEDPDDAPPTPLAANAQPNAPPTVPTSNRWDAEQLQIAATAIAVGKAHGIPAKGWVIAIASGLVESGLHNLDYGDADSEGYQQQRPSAGWGTVAQVRNVGLATEAFYGVAKHTNNRGLIDVYNWQNKPVGVVAQSVQVSAYPDRYAAKEDEARDIVALLSGTAAAAGHSGGVDVAPSITVSIASWNSAHWNSIVDTIEGARRIARTADVISFQELSGGNKQSAVEAALEDHFSFSSFDNQTKIAYDNDRFKLVSEKQQRAFPTTRVESTGRPNTGVYNEKFIQYIVLEDRDTGAQFAVVNSHAPNAIEYNGQPNKKHPIRVGLANTMFSKMASIAGPLGAEMPTFVTMDANVNARKAMKKPSPKFADMILGRVGFRSNYATLGFPKEQTHGERAIDYVYSSTRNTTPMYQTVYGTSGSDHAGIGVTARINTIRGTCTGPVESAATEVVGGGAVPADFDKQGNPRTVEQAVAWMQSKMPKGANGEPVQNACERYMNLSYGLGSGYPTARAHWNAPGPRSKGTSPAPRGSLVFFDSSNSAGHVALSIGKGLVVSTDFDSNTKSFHAGVIGVGTADEVARAMGGPVLGWRAPNFAVNSGR